MVSIRFVLTCLVSPTLIAGLGMLAMGTGIAPMDPKLPQIADNVLSLAVGLSIDYKLLLQGKSVFIYTHIYIYIYIPAYDI